MSKQKAREFLEYLQKNPELLDKMKGFTMDELKEAGEELRNEGKIEDVDFSDGPL
jgi:hypothetical protein